MNTLIQDIPIFNGNDSTQLEDCLVDIETAADLTAESRTKLFQAKSKGLTLTLITEALTSGKCWDDIKDLFHLKRCNLDFHTSVSHFINDVLQQSTETLCSAQKQTNVMNTLIQDIPIFNGNDSTQLEDCLVDIETAADLTAESRTKLFQAKSKVLT